MNHLGSPALAALLLLASLAQDAHIMTGRETRPLNVTWARFGLLAGKLTGPGRYQSETKIPPNAWRGLLPLKSSRADVEQVLGSPKGLVAGSYSYETKEEKVRVVYSQDSCEPTLEGRWKVPADTVLSITVFPQASVLVNSLQLDKSIYKRSQEVHPANWAWYVSPETGVMVHAMQNNGCEEVMSITYRPTAKDEELRCANNAKTAGKKP